MHISPWSKAQTKPRIQPKSFFSISTCTKFFYFATLWTLTFQALLSYRFVALVIAINIFKSCAVLRCSSYAYLITRSHTSHFFNWWNPLHFDQYIVGVGDSQIDRSVGFLINTKFYVKLSPAPCWKIQLLENSPRRYRWYKQQGHNLWQMLSKKQRLISNRSISCPLSLFAVWNAINRLYTKRSLVRFVRWERYICERERDFSFYCTFSFQFYWKREELISRCLT